MSCHAEVVWAQHTNGRPMPFDAEPSPEGTWLLERGAEGRVCTYVAPEAPVRRLAGPALKLHVSHFATCPNARQHRRRK